MHGIYSIYSDSTISSWWSRYLSTPPAPDNVGEATSPMAVMTLGTDSWLYVWCRLETWACRWCAWRSQSSQCAEGLCPANVSRMMFGRWEGWFRASWSFSCKEKRMQLKFCEKHLWQDVHDVVRPFGEEMHLRSTSDINRILEVSKGCTWPSCLFWHELTSTYSTHNWWNRGSSYVQLQ